MEERKGEREPQKPDLTGCCGTSVLPDLRKQAKRAAPTGPSSPALSPGHPKVTQSCLGQPHPLKQRSCATQREGPGTALSHSQPRELIGTPGGEGGQGLVNRPASTLGTWWKQVSNYTEPTE